MENKITPELILKAKQAKSPEELIALAKENGVELSDENAKIYFARINKTGELNDDELDNVAGGGCGGKSLSGSKKLSVSGRKLEQRCPVCHNDCWEESARTNIHQKWWYCCVCEKKNPSNVPTVSQPGQRSSFPSVTINIEI